MSEDPHLGSVAAFGLTVFSLMIRLKSINTFTFHRRYRPPSRIKRKRGVSSLKFSRDALANPLARHDQPMLAKRTGAEYRGLGFDFPNHLTQARFRV